MNVTALPTWEELKESKGELMREVAEFRAKLLEAKADDKISVAEAVGLALNGLGVMETVIAELHAIAVRISGMTPDERRSWICDIIYDAYKADFDFDIPWVPEPIEGVVERKVIKELAPQAIMRIEQMFHKGAKATA